MDVSHLAVIGCGNQLVRVGADGSPQRNSMGAAKAQIPRISTLTGIDAQQLESLVSDHTKGRELGIFGEPTVNVLKLNVDLQAMTTK